MTAIMSRQPLSVAKGKAMTFAAKMPTTSAICVQVPKKPRIEGGANSPM